VEIRNFYFFTNKYITTHNKNAVDSKNLQRLDLQIAAISIYLIITYLINNCPNAKILRMNTYRNEKQEYDQQKKSIGFIKRLQESEIRFRALI
jgi:hypothetical protein